MGWEFKIVGLLEKKVEWWVSRIAYCDSKEAETNHQQSISPAAAAAAASRIIIFCWLFWVCFFFLRFAFWFCRGGSGSSTEKKRAKLVFSVFFVCVGRVTKTESTGSVIYRQQDLKPFSSSARSSLCTRVYDGNSKLSGTRTSTIDVTVYRELCHRPDSIVHWKFSHRRLVHKTRGTESQASPICHQRNQSNGRHKSK